jgi:hypothetical protein
LPPSGLESEETSSWQQKQMTDLLPLGSCRHQGPQFTVTYFSLIWLVQHLLALCNRVKLFGI